MFADEIYCSSSCLSVAIDRCHDAVYVTIDLDVFDLFVMPSTGIPEPGGLLGIKLRFFAGMGTKNVLSGVI